MALAETFSTLPSWKDNAIAPESTAAGRSMPVPTNGASAQSRGTAWRCIFEPMRALLASSCSKNGMRAVDTLTNCSGETSIY